METDQLQGAELDAAVARVMGKQPQLRPDAKGALHCMVPYPQDCAPDAMVAFRPSRGGAAAWEALEWLARRQYIGLVWDDNGVWLGCRARRGDFGPSFRDEETIAIALCRAVVALGEAG